VAPFYVRIKNLHAETTVYQTQQYIAIVNNPILRSTGKKPFRAKIVEYFKNIHGR